MVKLILYQSSFEIYDPKHQNWASPYYFHKYWEVIRQESVVLILKKFRRTFEVARLYREYLKGACIFGDPIIARLRNSSKKHHDKLSRVHDARTVNYLSHFYKMRFAHKKKSAGYTRRHGKNSGPFVTGYESYSAYLEYARQSQW